MRIWRHHLYSDEQSLVTVHGTQVVIGRHPNCDVVLPSAFVAERAIVLQLTEGRWEVEAIGANGCQLSGFRLEAGQRATLDDRDEIKVAPFVLRLDFSADERDSGDTAPVDEQVADLLRALHLKLLDAISPSATDEAKSGSPEALLHFEHVIEELALELKLALPEQDEVMHRLAGDAVRGRLIDRVIGEGAKSDPLEHGERSWATLCSAVSDREADFERLADHVARRLEVRQGAAVSDNISRIERKFWGYWDKTDLLHDTYLYLSMREVKKQVKDLVFGYGPIEDLLRLPTITEIMVVRHDEIYVEKRSKESSGGVIERSGRRFVSKAAALSVIERIVQLANRQIDQSRPMVDARLADGSRINAVIAPVAMNGPTLTIRKAPRLEITMADWAASGLSEEAAKFLEASVRARRSILVIGGTGSGKTTLLNCLAEWIPARERLIVIEDTTELQLQHQHVVQMQTKPRNVENAGEILIRDLVRNALRMRPDRIIVGECRGAEALDMLQAMNTGHNGSMTTLHANSAEEAIERLEVMVKSAMDLPIDAIHRQISAAIDLVIEVSHEHDPRTERSERRVMRVCEASSVDEVTGRVEMKAIFESHAATGGVRMLPTGRLPSFIDDLAAQGLFSIDGFLYRQDHLKEATR